MGRPAVGRAVLAQPFFSRQQHWLPGAAPDRESQLLHRRAHRRFRLPSQPGPGVYDSRRPGKADVLRRFDEAIALVLVTLERQRDADWIVPYSAERQPDSRNRLAAFLRSAVHLDHHVGQIIYLSREVSGA